MFWGVSLTRFLVNQEIKGEGHLSALARQLTSSALGGD